jgi:hypothetical protein
MAVSRLTVELVRPVPVEPLTVAVRTTRPGRKVQLVEATLSAGDVVVARATGLRIRRATVELPEGIDVDEAPDLPPPDELPPTPFTGDWAGFHNQGADLRYTEPRQAGPAKVWIRLKDVRVVPDEEPSPLQRVAAVADFGNGVSSVVDFGGLLFINPDLTVYLDREPVGEWVLLDAVSRLRGTGRGLAESHLFDRRGRIGTSLQSLLVEPR